MALCRAETASTHRRFARAVMLALPRVVAADVSETAPVTTEVTLVGTEPVPPAVLDAVAMYDLGIASAQPNGDGMKVLVR